ncbi:1,6-anhydro-N-acetylmuramyl-L-alanine amidase AmpD [Solimonas soli]|uniref:1,6-anhydro-N-acetylmuramyl-L-alanine amidase AmpD n=1 Tax=Solimonas soli TaxID=413479 RepID=UPI0004B5D960|nr:1,6-anhydro-N-acetylmuramyl-L-alanine amidase AmpD [Solimonas soli]
MIEQTRKARKGSPRPEVSADGWLAGARVCRSPNRDARPDADDISLLVIHNISLPPGRFGGPYIDQLFSNTLDPAAHPYFATIHALRVSSHLLIARDGRVTQYVPFGERAWHAGVSVYEGRERCNDFSIGIELEGTDDKPFTAKQYAQLARVTRSLLRAYPRLSAARIAGHSDIAPGRKTDPGPHFDWRRYRSSL